MQRKSVLQPAIRASCNLHVLAHKSAPKPFLISRIDYNPSVIWFSPKHSTCPSGKLRTKITSPIAKSTSPALSDTTFFARCLPCHQSTSHSIYDVSEFFFSTWYLGSTLFQHEISPRSCRWENKKMQYEGNYTIIKEVSLKCNDQLKCHHGHP